MKNLINLVFFLLLFNITSCAQKKDVHIILLAGQSNMAGHGDYEILDASLKKRLEKVADRVLLSTSDNPKIAPRPLSYYTTEIEKYDFNKHFGPELFIGLTLAEANPKQEYLLIKKAVGGTSLYGAWSTDWSAEKNELAERGVRKKLKLYKAHLQNINANLTRLKKEGKTYKIIGLAWMQGESDTNKEITASSYQKNLQQLINGYRKQLKIESLPFVIGQVNPLPRKFKKGPGLVRNGMEEVARLDNKIEIVKTELSLTKKWNDFPKHSDNLHYNTEGQKRLGTAFANKLIALNKK
ncbi:sialate O-acetylesterase [uncultured Lutibacter sp.]|uniref:sialate O-acetylesterase n=1 Tax=uncultured Lutibacter sp. TaxID=437739 RepID=UPI002625E38D|nr:sialate O-acetylesterase [uncultured Lutibacter sp.]